jgi:fused signal recognition particle receptor
VAGLWGKIAQGLAKTGRQLKEGLSAIFVGGPQLSPDTLDRLEALLIGADLGMEITERFLAGLRVSIERKEATDLAALKARLRAYLITILKKGAASPRVLPPPRVTLFVGVNGVGKTTTIGKRAYQLKQEGRSVLLAAADTFRAGAIEQLLLWGKRCDVEVIRHQAGADPSAVVFDAVTAARARSVDHLLIDTAGRLQTKYNLMAELNKIDRVITKALAVSIPFAPSSPSHEKILVLDATTGQNALSQARLFHAEIGVSGLILTKLDGTARGGIVVPIVEALSVPVTHIGVGEGLDDLIPFDIESFAQAILEDA